MTSKPPKNIYLNVGFNKSEADLQDVDFSTLSNISWSEERMSDNDIKYSKVHSDEDAYIRDLEGIVTILAQTYEKLKDTYFDNHMNTCSITNPSRRDLTEAEQSEWQRFPLFQGTRLQNIIRQFAETDKPIPVDIPKTLDRFKS